MKFIAEKVSHNPFIMAFHAEGEGWELGASSAGRTKFWGNGFFERVPQFENLPITFDLGKSLEIIPIGTIHVKMGDDHYQWWVLIVPASLDELLLQALKEETIIIHAKPYDGHKVPRTRWDNDD